MRNHSEPIFTMDSVDEKATALSDCLLIIDVVTQAAYLPCTDSSALDFSILMQLGENYKQYKRIPLPSPIVAIKIKAPRFSLSITPKQISGKLHLNSGSEEFMSFYVSLVNKLIPFNFTGKMSIYTKSNSSHPVVEKTHLSILNAIKINRSEDSYQVCETSPCKLNLSQSSDDNVSVFVPKITIAITLSMRALEESLTPRSDESPRSNSSTPREETTPRSMLSTHFEKASPRQESPRQRSSSNTKLKSEQKHVSPRQEISPEEPTLSQQKGSPREVGLFRRLSTRLFPLVSPKPASPTSEALYLADDQLSPKARSHTTQPTITLRKKSVSGKSGDEICTEISYSPRSNSIPTQLSSPRSLSTLSQESTDTIITHEILHYCRKEIIIWCKKHNHTHKQIKRNLIITLNNNDVISIQGHYIHANSLDPITSALMVDLIKCLAFVENAKIYYVSPETKIDETILAGLTLSSSDTFATDEDTQFTL